MRARRCKKRITGKQPLRTLPLRTPPLHRHRYVHNALRTLWLCFDWSENRYVRYSRALIGRLQPCSDWLMVYAFGIYKFTIVLYSLQSLYKLFNRNLKTRMNNRRSARRRRVRDCGLNIRC